MEYSHYYKDGISLDDLGNGNWDVLISAHNLTERVLAVFQAASAHEKHWICHSEYGLSADVAPEEAFRCDAVREDEFILQFFEDRFHGKSLENANICVDITGFMRPHLLYLMHYFSAMGVRGFDALYAEPGHYKKLDDTPFAAEQVYSVRQVAGFEGAMNNRTDNDLLIINAGFEDKLTAEVAEDKDKAEKILLLGLPSLKADMYQQGVLRTQRARDALGEGTREVFAQASDPFATATILSEIVDRARTEKGIDNLYLSPLATKPSALGFGLFYIRECRAKAASIIFPYSRRYSAESSEGIGRLWKYEISLQ